eukprot:2438342-Rhodomonas_salina.1
MSVARINVCTSPRTCAHTPSQHTHTRPTHTRPTHTTKQFVSSSMGEGEEGEWREGTWAASCGWRVWRRLMSGRSRMARAR